MVDVIKLGPTPTDVLIAITVGGVVAYFSIKYLAKKQNIEIHDLSDVVRVLHNTVSGATNTGSPGTPEPGTNTVVTRDDGGGGGVSGTSSGALTGSGSFPNPLSPIAGQPVTEEGLDIWNQMIEMMKNTYGGEGGGGGGGGPGATAGGAGGQGLKYPPSRPLFYDTETPYGGGGEGGIGGVGATSTSVRARINFVPARAYYRYLRNLRRRK